MSKRCMPTESPKSLKIPKLEVIDNNEATTSTSSHNLKKTIKNPSQQINYSTQIPSTSKAIVLSASAIVVPASKFRKSKNPNLLRSILGFSNNLVNILCPLCKKIIVPKKGLVLHKCEHSFCKNCFLTLYSKTKDDILYCPANNCAELIINSSIKENIDNRRRAKYAKEPNNNWLCTICEIRNAMTIKICKFCNTAKIEKLEYEELLALEDSNHNLVLNYEKFDCPICFGNYKPGEGIIIRNCFHTFCRECLTNYVKLSEVSEINCPETGCEFFLQDREIRTILTKDDYENYLRKGLNTAENQATKSFHCKTPNCKVWWINDENVNLIKCGVCFKINCISCNAIHEGLNCKEYQDNLLSGPNELSNKTMEMLNNLLATKAAIKCRCGIIIQRSEGCDWLLCSMCKTEICWATMGFRWGPKGKGDISGGCKCMIGGKRCTPNCKNCH